MVAPLIGAAAIDAGSNFLGGILGGSKTPEVPRTPYDQRPQRRNIIGLQNYLLGFSPGFTPYDRQVPGGTWGGQLGSPYQQPQQPQQQLPPYMGGPIQQRPGGGLTGGLGQLAGQQGQYQSPWQMAQQQQMSQPMPANAGGAQQFGGQMMNATGGSGGPTGISNTGQISYGNGTTGQAGQVGMPGQSPGAVPFNGPMMNAQGGLGGATYGQNQLAQGPANNDMLGRMESYFGPLGTPTTALQQQSMNGISQFLNSNPYGQSNGLYGNAASGQNYNEANNAFRGVQNANYFGGAQNAFGQAGNAFGQVGDANYFNKAEDMFSNLGNYNPFGAAQSSMEGILGKNPGMQGMDALAPLLERNLAAANQQGGRFGSANAILRSRAVDDNNMLAAQMYQKGVDQQIGAAGQYGQMGSALLGARGQAGQGMLGVGQGRLQQGLGAAQGQLGVGQGMLGVGQGRLDQGLGAANGLGGLAQALSNNQLGAAQGMANNQNMFMGNQVAGYGVGQQQAQQEAERQQQALAILMQQLGVGEQGSLMGRG